MKKAVEIALAPDGNTRVRLAEEAIKQAEARSAQSRAALLPDLEGYLSEVSQTRNLRALGIQFPAIPGFQFPSVVGPFDVFDARASVTQSIFDFSAIRRYQAAKVAVQAVKAETEGTRDQVTDQVARAYLNSVRAQAALETADANIALSEALVALAQSQKNAGTGTGIEITRAQVQLANDKQRKIVVENDLSRANLQLLKLIGVHLDNAVELTDRLSYIAADLPRPEEALVIARAHRADMKAQQYREENARLTNGATKYERLPSLGFSADYGTIGSGINEAIPTHSYGVTLRVPVFDGGRRDARRAEAASQYRQEKIRSLDVRDQIELDVRVALNNLRSAQAQVQTAEEGLKLAQNELAQARRRYEAGVAIGLEVTDAQARLDRARENHISALYNHNLARIDLGSATGTIETLIH